MYFGLYGIFVRMGFFQGEMKDKSSADFEGVFLETE